MGRAAIQIEELASGHWAALRPEADKVHARLRSQTEHVDHSRRNDRAWMAAAEALALALLDAGDRVCAQPAASGCGDPASCEERCGVEYWMAHSRHVASDLQRLALALDEPADEWHLVGLVHDADYPAHPHHVPGVPADKAHPLTLVHRLEAVGTPAHVLLAVLEHSAHTEYRPSTRLSAALILADENSTTTGAGLTLQLRTDEEGAALLARLTPASHGFTGFKRDNMDDRAQIALDTLIDG